MNQARLIIFALLLLSCGHNTAKTEKANEDSLVADTAYGMDDLKKMSTATEAMANTSEALRKMKPLAPAALTAMLPKDFSGFRLTDVHPGKAAVNARYRKGNQILDLTFYDCAGEAGADVYNLRYWSAMDINQEDENESTKTIVFKDGKAVEHYRKTDRQATLTWFTNDRFLLVMKGRDFTPEEVRTSANGLRLNP